MRVEIDNWRWAGDAVLPRTGKRLPRAGDRDRGALSSRRRTCRSRARTSPTPQPNEMVLSVQPDEGASLRLVAKVPGQTMSVRPVQMEFKYGDLVPGRLAGGLRAAAPRRPARRRDAVHARGRGRGGVEDRRPDPRGLGFGAGPAGLRGRQPGARRGGRAAGRSRDGAGGRFEREGGDPERDRWRGEGVHVEHVVDELDRLHRAHTRHGRGHALTRTLNLVVAPGFSGRGRVGRRRRSAASGRTARRGP